MLASTNSRSTAGPRARKQPRQRRSRETVSVILAAATRIFTTRGYLGATTNHIATKAGVSIGSLYQYFPDKAALAAALEQQHLDEAAPALLATAQRLRGTSVPAWVRSFTTAVIAANDDPVHLALYGVTPRTPALQARLEALVAAFAAELVPSLRGPHKPVRARLAIATILVLVHELVIAAPARERRPLTAEVVRMVSTYLLPPRP
jgi:AcrR family transcriptional regulator